MRLTSGILSREEGPAFLFRRQLLVSELARENIDRWKNWNIRDTVSLESAAHGFQHIMRWKWSLHRLDLYEANAPLYASVTL
jgi:hypothetical protein